MSRVLKTVGMALAVAALASCAGGTPQGPEQPIAFYHNVHAGDNQIPCMYCHYSADRGPSAGLPSVAQCVGCHVPGSAVIPPEQAQLAFPTPDRDEFWHQEAQKLVGYWQRQEAIPWVQVYKVPEHVRFPHQSHVRVGLQCQTCHGPVEEMDVIYQWSSLQMGWCIDCHRGSSPLSAEEEAAVQERSTYVRRIASLASAGSDVRGALAVNPNQRASIDCVVCHY